MAVATEQASACCHIVVHAPIAMGRGNAVVKIKNRATIATALGKSGGDMIIKSKKNLVWLCVFVIAAIWVGVHIHNRTIQRERQELNDKIKTLREERRMFNARTLREAGIRAKIADGAEDLPDQDVALFCDLIRSQSGREVATSDVAMWHEEAAIKLLLTADTLYLCNPQAGVVKFWDLCQMDVSDVEWERTSYGDMFICGKSYHFLVDARKPFTDAIRKIIVNSKIHSEGNALSERLRELN